MEYNFKEIEPKWQRRWRENKTYKVETDPSRPKFYVLDMFPYPSGAGLHLPTALKSCIETPHHFPSGACTMPP